MLAAVLLGWVGGEPARAELQIESVIWGLDGQVTPYQFAPLSILVGNPKPAAFDGTLRLEKSINGLPVGAPHEQALYLSPSSSKWVQFYPYVRESGEQWTLTWDEGRARADLPPASFRTQRERDRPSIVLLQETEAVASRRGPIRTFPEELFPPAVTATDGLDVVLLDHAPRWPEARRQAFLDWLARGGTLHLLLGPDGQSPRFPPEMDALNSPLDRFHYGAGLVLRTQRRAGQIDEPFLKETVPQETAQRLRKSKTALDEARELVGREETDLYREGDQIFLDDFAAGLFRDLRSLSIPRHNWPLIYLLSLAYLGLIFPGCWFVGRRWPGARNVYGALLGGIVLFGLALGLLGRRGHGEQAGIHTVALARRLPDNHWDVSGWSNIFALRGDLYEITHEGTGRLYSPGQDVERIHGVIHNGADGRFRVEIPGYSSRPFTFRLKSVPLDLPVTVARWAVEDEKLKTLELSLGAGFPRTTGLPAWAVYRDRIYPLTHRGNRLRLAAESGQPLGEYLRVLETDAYWHYVFPDVWGQPRIADREVFNRLPPALIAMNLGVDDARRLQAFQLPPDRVRLFVSAPLPPEFRVTTDGLPAQRSTVLYAMDLFEPGSP